MKYKIDKGITVIKLENDIENKSRVQKVQYKGIKESSAFLNDQK